VNDSRARRLDGPGAGVDPVSAAGSLNISGAETWAGPEVGVGTGGRTTRVVLRDQLHAAVALDSLLSYQSRICRSLL
jgi:hypothetical protein